MKKDPSALNPLVLSKPPKGGWRYIQNETGFDIQGKNAVYAQDSFWSAAMRLARHRRGNKLEGASHEQAQRDILIYTRNYLGLPDTSAIIAMTPAQQFVQKVKGGCGACAKRKAERDAKKLAIGTL